MSDNWCPKFVRNSTLPLLAFTVSADGPVSVFSEGVKLAELRKGAYEQGRLLNEIAEDRDDITAEEWELVCSRCGKPSVVGYTAVPRWNERLSPECEVCGTTLIHEKAFSVYARVIKK